MKYIRSQIEVLSEEEIHRIHQASLEILASVGVQVPNAELLERLDGVGAMVQGDIALLPERVIDRMLEECIATSGDPPPDDWAINRGQVRVTSGNETLMLDYDTPSRRPGVMDDILKGIVLTNALPTVAWAMPVVKPTDVPDEVAAIEAYRLGLTYSHKPFQVYFGLKECPYLMDMAALAADATGQSRRELGFEFNFGIISPLRFAQEDLACAMMTAEQDWPTGCFSFVVVGASSPASMAGVLALSNAERLACLTLMWLWGELGGYGEGFVDDPCMIEPHTLATSFGHPNLTTLAIAVSQLSRYYGLKPGGGLALSDAKQIDFQSGFERGMGAVFCMMAGGGIGNSGIVGPDEAISFEQLVIDDAALGAINWITQGIEVTDETLAVDLVKQVGIGGSFLDQMHTAKSLRREYWNSPIFTRSSWSDWEQGGQETLEARAHAEVLRMLSADYPPQAVLKGTVIDRLSEIVEQAHTELVGNGT